jgi:hypothetical protein
VQLNPRRTKLTGGPRCSRGRPPKPGREADPSRGRSL